MNHETLKAKKDFPAEVHETLVVRDGQGRIVERMTCVAVVPESKTAKRITYRVTKPGEV